MKSTKILALLLVVIMCFSVLASCVKPNDNPGTGDNNTPGGDTPGGDTPGGDTPGGDTPGGDEVVPYVPKQAEYNTFTSVMPSNWNELTYQDNNDTQIMSYLASSFYEYDYMFEGGKKFNADGSINADAIVPGAFTTSYSAATKLEDVTSTVDAKWNYSDEQKEEGGYAWKITLRNDLKWDDGTPIVAADFVYSMQQQLDPKFMNYRGNTFYDTLMIKNSKEYFFSGAPIYKDVYNWDTDETAEGPYFVNFGAGWSGNSNYSVDWMYSNGYLFNDYEKQLDADGKPVLDENGDPVYILDENGNKIQTAFGITYYEELSELANEFGYLPVEGNEDKLGAIFIQFLSAFGIGEADASAYYPTFYFYFAGYGDEVDWNTVGIYSIDSENAIVVCLDKSYSLLTEDGDLSVWAPYYMSSLPLVHKEKYEANKHEPAEGATLMTSTYNSSLDSTASWGPYKLTQYVDGSHYKLEKNEHWFGWNLEQYKNQYNITAINCRKVEESSTQWLGFLAGIYDDAALSTDNYEDYKDSKYVTYNLSTGTYGMQLFSDLNTLKGSGNNNGILAIQEFRHAINLATNRTDIVEKIWPGSTVPCFGLLNSMYFYDIENSTTLDDGGIYRNTEEAMAGILRAYGFTETNGLWSNGTLNGYSLEEAYDALTGYNLDLAKQKMKEAIDLLEGDAEYYGYDPSKKITIVYGSSKDDDKQRFRCDYVAGIINELVVGTSLEGKIEVVFDASAGSGWADAFRTGKTQIGFGYGFTGNAFNPFDIIGAFVNPDDSLNYHAYWDTSKVSLALALPEGDYEGAGQTHTMSVQNWFYCLNGLAENYNQEFTFNWSEGHAPSNARLIILAALEELALKESRSIMLIGDAGGAFHSAKYSYVNYDYNTFMGYGGMRYMNVEYTDAEWAEFVKANNNELSNVYKQSE